MKKTCLRCGQCCANVPLTLSEKELYDDWVRWLKDHGHHFRQIHTIFPMLVFKRHDKKRERYIFHCTHLRVEKHGKTSCRIHKHRPDMCRNYPNETALRMGMRALNNRSEFKGCGYNDNKKYGRKFTVSQLRAS